LPILYVAEGGKGKKERAPTLQVRKRKKGKSNHVFYAGKPKEGEERGGASSLVGGRGKKGKILSRYQDERKGEYLYWGRKMVIFFPLEWVRKEKRSASSDGSGGKVSSKFLEEKREGERKIYLVTSFWEKGKGKG